MDYSHNLGRELRGQQQASPAIRMESSSASMAGPMSPPYYGQSNPSMPYFISSGISAPMDDCSSGFQSASVSNYSSTLPSSASTTINEYPPQQMPHSSQQQQQPQPQQRQQPLHNTFNTTSMSQLLQQLPPNIDPSKLIAELGELGEDRDPVIVLHSVLVLFTGTVNCVEVRQHLSASPKTLNLLYSLLTDASSNDEPDEVNDINAYFAGATIEYISRYEEGRSALLGCNGLEANEWPSKGIKTLISSLKSHNSQVVVFAIQAIHRLLIDSRLEVQDIAKKQIIYAGGVKSIVGQLATPLVDSENICQFKVIVMTCLQILAYGNMENKLAIFESGGPGLLLQTIKENLTSSQKQGEELIETASRVLKSLSVCPANKDDIIRNDGIGLLTECIKRDNQEILKTCLWTLRNLSDVINNNLSHHGTAVNLLVEGLLAILPLYTEEPSILSCALGILANITCGNEAIKKFICGYNNCSGIELLLNAIDVALLDLRMVNNEVLEPAVYTLCHLMNQATYLRLPLERERVKMHFMKYDLIKRFNLASTSDDVAKAVAKLVSLLGYPDLHYQIH